MNARAAYRVTIAKLGCQRHPRPGLETPPQLKGGASGPGRHLYSAVIDVSQTSVTPSGGTQSAPMLSLGSLFMSSPLSSGSQKCRSCLGRPTRSWAPTKAGAAHRGLLVGLYLPGRLMLIQRQPDPSCIWMGHCQPGWDSRWGWGESQLTQRRDGPGQSDLSGWVHLTPDSAG